MSSLVVSSKYIEIERNSFGIITIKNVKSNANAESYPVLYKVKTNLRDLVDVRPSFGILESQSQRSTFTLNVKFSGNQEQIDKGKLMISWFSTENKKEFENRKFNHDEFNTIFNNAKRITQGSLLLPFIFKENAEKQRVQQNKSVQNQSHPNEESLPVSNESSSSQKIEKNESIEPNQDNQSKFESVSSDISSQGPSIKQKTGSSGYSCKVIGLVMMIAFILGVSVGIKFQRFIQPLANELNELSFSFLKSGSIEQTQVHTILANETVLEIPPQSQQVILTDNQQKPLQVKPVIDQNKQVVIKSEAVQELSEQVEIIDI